MTKALLKNPRTTSDHGDAPHTARPHTIRTNPRKTIPRIRITVRTPTPPTTGGPMLASTIQFSNHHPTRTPTPHQQAPGSQPGGQPATTPPHGGPVAAREPNSTHHTTTTDTTVIQYDSSTPARTGSGANHHINEPAPNTTAHRPCSILRRKEVIQPHLPVRLPCYDLVPITSLTLDGSPHEGRATGFGCYPLS